MTYCRELKLVEGMETDGVCTGRTGGEKGVQRTTIVCTMGCVVEDGGEGKITYDSGSRKCVVVREGMEVEELRGLVQEIVGDGVVVERL